MGEGTESLVRCSLASLIGSLLLSGAARAVPPAQPEDALLKALREELARSVANLKLEKLDKPYFIEYAVLDGDSFEVEASFGAVVHSTRERSRPLRVDVRVGDYSFDSSGFLPMSSLYSFRGLPRQLVLEDDVQALRHDLWLATDEAYKQALERLAQKRAFIQNKVQTEQVPDFSREQATTVVAPRQVPSYDQAKWEKVVRSLSGIFREFPAIQESSVRLRIRVATRYLLNSEGTVVRQPASLATLSVRAATQASNGAQLKHFLPFYGTSPGQLPPEAEVASAIRGMAQELTTLAGAPLLEEYVGPVLVSGRAAGQLLAQVLSPHLSGLRPPLVEEPQMEAMLPRSELMDRLNRPVLPSFLSLLDDPTQSVFEGQPLLGAYAVDEQGVPPKPVVLVENGVLKTLLMSRRPSKEIPQSNGHGRAAGTAPPSTQLGNLFVRSSEGKTPAELKQQLLEACRKQGLAYGVVLKLLDDPAITGRDASSYFTIGGRGRQSVTAPVLAVKVYVEDGREEMVRGVSSARFRCAPCGTSRPPGTTLRSTTASQLGAIRWV